VRETSADKITLYGVANYARSNGLTTADLLRLGGRYDFNLASASSPSAEVRPRPTRPAASSRDTT
jgi:hypothetical protein